MLRTHLGDGGQCLRVRADEAEDGGESLLAVYDLVRHVGSARWAEQDHRRQRDASQDRLDQQLAILRRPDVRALEGRAELRASPAFERLAKSAMLQVIACARIGPAALRLVEGLPGLDPMAASSSDGSLRLSPGLHLFDERLHQSHGALDPLQEQGQPLEVELEAAVGLSDEFAATGGERSREADQVPVCGLVGHQAIQATAASPGP